VRLAGLAGLAGLAWGALGCGGATAAAPPRGEVGVAKAPARTSAAGAPPADATSDGVLPFDTLAARGATDAPLMREALRASALPSPELRADRDLCVRAVVAASAPLRVWLADAGGARRGDAAAVGATAVGGAASVLVPPAGPACVKRGEAVRLVAEGAAPPVVRAILFAAP